MFLRQRLSPLRPAGASLRDRPGYCASGLGWRSPKVTGRNPGDGGGGMGGQGYACMCVKEEG